MSRDSQSRISRRGFLAAGTAGILGGALVSCRQQPKPQPKAQPNIVVILVDDLGYGDLGCQGSKEAITPNIDSIAAHGVRFTDGYVTAPLCSPSRSGLLMGRYQQRCGLDHNPPKDDENELYGLPVSEKTLADMLKARGYTTGAVGKWHLGMHPKFHPLKRGFDQFFGFLAGVHAYKGVRRSEQPILRGNEPVVEKDHLTNAFSREAVSFVDANRGRPFFLYLAYNAVHFQLFVPEKARKPFASMPRGKRQTLLSALWMVDQGVGTVLAKLRELDLERDTLVFFLSDNGGYANNASLNGPLKDGKGSLYEGGIRVPFVAQWRGRFSEGAVCSEPVSSLDIAATALAAAGAGQQPTTAAGPALDGVDLLPVVTKQRPGPAHDRLFWRFRAGWAVRQGNWKLVKTRRDPTCLFDLSSDLAEQRDMLNGRPQIVAELSAAYEAWNKQMAAPLWLEVPATAPATTQPDEHD